MTENQAPAGWYPDGSGATRWWDGSQWTARVREEGPGAPKEASDETPGRLAKRGDEVDLSSVSAEPAREPEKRRSGSWSNRAAQWKEQAQGVAEKSTQAYKKTAETYKQSQLPPGHDAELHGPLVVKAEVGMKTLELYERGYLRASGPFGKANFERVISVKYRESTNTFNQDQSIVGGAVTNALTLGMGSTENVKTQTTGTITVTTGSNLYTGTIKAKHGRIFESYGERWMGSAQPSAAPTAPAQPDIPDQIQKLADLHAAGILTAEEFAAKKTDLLGRM